MKATAAAAVRGSRGRLRSDAAKEAAKAPVAVLRRADAADLDELLRLEEVCFEDWRRDSRRMIRESLKNPRHEVWVQPDLKAEPGRLAATLVLRWHLNALRVYSLATDPSRQGSGLGRGLMDFARCRAQDCGVRTMRLEADAGRQDLLEWYERLGFTRETLLQDFYAPGRDAWRMIAKLADAPERRPE